MRASIAVEIGERWLKIMVARQGAPQCLLRPVQGLSDEQVTQALTAMLKELKVKPRPVALCLPRNQVTVRNLHLPSQDPKEIAQMIELNIVRMVPYRKEEILSNYRLLGVDDIGYSKIMLAIVHRDLVKRHVDILEGAGLSVERVSLSSHASWLWMAARHGHTFAESDLVLLLDLEAGYIDFLLCSRKALFFSRSIAIEADQLTDEAGLARLLNEINQSLEIFQNEEMNRRPAKVFVGGAETPMPMVEKAIKEGLNLPVSRVAGPVKSRPEAPGPAAGCSLNALAHLIDGDADQELSFVLPELQIRQSLKEKTRELILIGSVSLYVIIALMGFFMSRLHHQQNYLDSLRQRSASIEQEIGDLVSQSRRVEVVKNYLTTRELPLRYLAELQKIIPAEVALDFMSVDEQQRGVLRGQALQLSDVFKLITSLENSRYIEQVDTKYTRRKKVRETEITEFELVMRVRL